MGIGNSSIAIISVLLVCNNMYKVLITNNGN